LSAKNLESARKIEFPLKSYLFFILLIDCCIGKIATVTFGSGLQRRGGFALLILGGTSFEMTSRLTGEPSSSSLDAIGLGPFLTANPSLMTGGEFNSTFEGISAISWLPVRVFFSFSSFWLTFSRC
jgi:hypothetical protein